MLRATELAASSAPGFAGVSYDPQISYLSRRIAHLASAGRSWRAAGPAPVLVTMHASGIRAPVFVARNAIQLGATLLVLTLAARGDAISLTGGMAIANPTLGSRRVARPCCPR